MSLSERTYRAVRRRATTAVRHVLAFYSTPLGWAAWAVTSVSVAYGAGAVLFWVHAVFRGEAGPAIANVAHWLLDSTLGLFALSPAVFLLLPAALWGVRRLGIREPGARATGFAALAGTALALITAPGPLMHGVVAGPHSWLGRAAVGLFGRDAAVAARNAQLPGHPALSEGLVQLAVGVPLYLVAILMAIALVRLAVILRRPAILRRLARPVEATEPPAEVAQTDVSPRLDNLAGGGDAGGPHVREQEGAVR